MQRYQVRFVDDTALPEGVAWTFARQAGRTYLFVKESAIDTTTGQCDALTRAWECWQRTGEQPRPSRIRADVGHLRNLTAILLAAYGIPAVKVGAAVL